MTGRPVIALTWSAQTAANGSDGCKYPTTPKRRSDRRTTTFHANPQENP